jgi:hypothetical protein
MMITIHPTHDFRKIVNRLSQIGQSETSCIPVFLHLVCSGSARILTTKDTLGDANDPRNRHSAPAHVLARSRLRNKPSNPKMGWDADQIVNVIVLAPENSHHVTDKLIPESVSGLAIAELPAYCDDLLKKVAAQTTEYHRRGKVHVRKQKVSQPVLLCVVTSWPEPYMLDTDERKEWLALGNCLNVIVKWCKRRRKNSSSRSCASKPRLRRYGM